MKIALETEVQSIMAQTGNRNTKFFQRMANVHRRNNTVDKPDVNWVTEEDSGSIKRETLTFYHKLYDETEDWRPEFNNRIVHELLKKKNSGCRDPLKNKRYWTATKCV